jgi:hypothetical protein
MFHINPLSCTTVSPSCTVSTSIYGYRPSLPSTITFLTLFTLLTSLNLFLGIRFHTWAYLIAMTLASLLSTIGYIGRLFLPSNPFNFLAFEVALCCITIAPAFNAAAIYLTLKHVVIAFGEEFAVMRPAMYTYVFIGRMFLLWPSKPSVGGWLRQRGKTPGWRGLGTIYSLREYPGEFHPPPSKPPVPPHP